MSHLILFTRVAVHLVHILWTLKIKTEKENFWDTVHLGVFTGISAMKAHTHLARVAGAVFRYVTVIHCISAHDSHELHLWTNQDTPMIGIRNYQLSFLWKGGAKSSYWVNEAFRVISLTGHWQMRNLGVLNLKYLYVKYTYCTLDLHEGTAEKYVGVDLSFWQLFQNEGGSLMWHPTESF